MAALRSAGAVAAAWPVAGATDGKGKGLSVRRPSTQSYTAITWDAKAAQVMAVYDWVLGRRTDKPVPFPAPAPATGHAAATTPAERSAATPAPDFARP